MKKNLLQTDFPLLFEKKCSQCGKIFYPAYGHVFKKEGKWFCKRSCELAFDREQERIKAEKKTSRRLPVLMTKLENGAVLQFGSAADAAARLDLSEAEIRRCCRGEVNSYRGYRCEYRKELAL